MELGHQAEYSIVGNLYRNEECGQNRHFTILIAYILTRDNIHLIQKRNHQDNVPV